MEYRVMKHVHPGENMSDDWVSVLDISGSDLHTLKYALARHYNDLLKRKKRLQARLAKRDPGPSARMRVSPATLAMELADIKMLYDKIAQAVES